MARNVVDVGVDVTGFDLDTERVDKFDRTGGNPAAELTAVTDRETVVLSLRSLDQVRQMSTELSGATDLGSLFVDMSTIDPLTTERAKPTESASSTHRSAAVWSVPKGDR